MTFSPNCDFISHDVSLYVATATLSKLKLYQNLLLPLILACISHNCDFISHHVTILKN